MYLYMKMFKYTWKILVNLNKFVVMCLALYMKLNLLELPFMHIVNPC